MVVATGSGPGHWMGADGTSTIQGSCFLAVTEVEVQGSPQASHKWPRGFGSFMFSSKVFPK